MQSCTVLYERNDDVPVASVPHGAEHQDSMFMNVSNVGVSGSVSRWTWVSARRRVVLRYSESGMAATSCRG